jgi:hypothetical protein
LKKPSHMNGWLTLPTISTFISLFYTQEHTWFLWTVRPTYNDSFREDTSQQLNINYFCMCRRMLYLYQKM